MPELPEVETVCRGLIPQISGRTVIEVLIKQPRLRWSIPTAFAETLRSQSFQAITRRGKYLLFDMTQGTVIAHLGMSGSFRVCTLDTPLKKHDHVFIRLDNQRELRYHDPRRFGSIHWTDQDPLQHPLLRHLGPEPLDKNFTAKTLYQLLSKRKKSVKACLMDHHLLVGVGNIYATEALFIAKVSPKRPADQVSMNEAKLLYQAIQTLLKRAIDLGGTTLKDFVNADAKPGYFQQTLLVYGRHNEACSICQTPLESMTIAQRSSVFCPRCQT